VYDAWLKHYYYTKRAGAIYNHLYATIKLFDNHWVSIKYDDISIFKYVPNYPLTNIYFNIYTDSFYGNTYNANFKNILIHILYQYPFINIISHSLSFVNKGHYYVGPENSSMAKQIDESYQDALASI
jgi:hypothetical protein